VDVLLRSAYDLDLLMAALLLRFVCFKVTSVDYKSRRTIKSSPTHWIK
jgi:hypothetical protein